jgi:hypothetical protein
VRVSCFFVYFFSRTLFFGSFFGRLNCFFLLFFFFCKFRQQTPGSTIYCHCMQDNLYLYIHPSLVFFFFSPSPFFFVRFQSSSFANGLLPDFSLVPYYLVVVIGIVLAGYIRNIDRHELQNTVVYVIYFFLYRAFFLIFFFTFSFFLSQAFFFSSYQIFYSFFHNGRTSQRQHQLR